MLKEHTYSDKTKGLKQLTFYFSIGEFNTDCIFHICFFKEYSDGIPEYNLQVSTSIGKGLALWIGFPYWRYTSKNGIKEKSVNRIINI